MSIKSPTGRVQRALGWWTCGGAGTHLGGCEAPHPFPIWISSICGSKLSNLGRASSFPGGAVPASSGDAREEVSIPGSGRCPAVGNGNPPQYSYMENSMNRGGWCAILHGVAKSQTWLSTWAYTHTGGGSTDAQATIWTCDGRLQ